MITEKDREREKLKKSLETKINTLEDQLRNADHQKQTLIDEKVKTTFIKGLIQENKIFISLSVCYEFTDAIRNKAKV